MTSPERSGGLGVARALGWAWAQVQELARAQHLTAAPAPFSARQKTKSEGGQNRAAPDPPAQELPESRQRRDEPTKAPRGGRGAGRVGGDRRKPTAGGAGALEPRQRLGAHAGVSTREAARSGPRQRRSEEARRAAPRNGRGRCREPPLNNGCRVSGRGRCSLRRQGGHPPFPPPGGDDSSEARGVGELRAAGGSPSASGGLTSVRAVEGVDRQESRVDPYARTSSRAIDSEDFIDMLFNRKQINQKKTEVTPKTSTDKSFPKTTIKCLKKDPK